ncbi:MAG: hypothetical protein RL214_141 [Pseudomonadota bacterium]|jgi:hypothetical protein
MAPLSERGIVTSLLLKGKLELGLLRMSQLIKFRIN